MKCTTCQATIPDGSQFCLKCGAQTATEPKATSSKQASSKASMGRETKRITLVLLGLLGILSGWPGLDAS